VRLDVLTERRALRVTAKTPAARPAGRRPRDQ
jgi:hypothetical protein